jgi:hypothetical protein
MKRGGGGCGNFGGCLYGVTVVLIISHHHHRRRQMIAIITNFP